jgi:hypothetical protein
MPKDNDPARLVAEAIGMSELALTPLSHPVGLVRPIELPASARAEGQCSEGGVPAA